MVFIVAGRLVRVKPPEQQVTPESEMSSIRPEPRRVLMELWAGSLVGSGKPQCHHGVQYSIRQYALRHDGNVGDAPRGVDQDRG